MRSELKETRTKGNSESNGLTNKGSIYTHWSQETSKNSDDEDDWDIRQLEVFSLRSRKIMKEN